MWVPNYEYWLSYEYEIVLNNTDANSFNFLNRNLENLDYDIDEYI